MTLLHQMLDHQNMCEAWEAVAENNGMPGVDGIPIKKWRRSWEENLVNLERDVRKNSYKPSKLRTCRIHKSDHREFRTLKIPTVKDRVLQRAVMQVLMPFYENMFFDSSFGYRPNRGLLDAVQQIIHCREEGNLHVLNADIDAFFDEVDHELLLRFLQADLEDDSLINLISSWLEASISMKQPSKGIPQGSPLSPLLANVYLHRLDTDVITNGFELIRYADDFIIMEKSKNSLNKALQCVIHSLEKLQLALEPRKTFFSTFDDGFFFLGIKFFRSTYSYTWKDKEIIVDNKNADWLFFQYGHEYDQGKP